MQSLRYKQNRHHTRTLTVIISPFLTSLPSGIWHQLTSYAAQHIIRRLRRDNNWLHKGRRDLSNYTTHRARVSLLLVLMGGGSDYVVGGLANTLQENILM